MDWRSVGWISLCGALAILVPELSFAQLAHPGYSGLISTPNAEVVPQGQLALGFNWVDGPNTYLFAPRTNRIYAVTVGILPGLEATLRQTQVIGWLDPEAPGVQHAFDRMFSAKYAFPMPQGLPRMAIGMQDIASGNFLSGVRGARPGATQYGQSTVYGVIGENYPNWGWHGGLATSEAFLNGMFAGVRYSPIKTLELLGEWDSRGLNWGLRVLAPQGFWAQFALVGRKTVGGSIGLNVVL